MSVLREVKKAILSLPSRDFFEKVVLTHYESEILGSDSFIPLTQEVKRDTSTIIGIDGGNATIYLSPTIGVFVIRVASVSITKREVYSWLVSVIQTDSQTFSITYQSIQGDLEHPDITQIKRSDVQQLRDDSTILLVKISQIIRKIAELSLAHKKSMDEDTIIILDGSLHAQLELEKTYLEKLQSNRVVGVSKTTSILTNTFRPVTTALLQLQPSQTSWVIPHILTPVDIKKAVAYISFAKLHANAKNIFRIDTFTKSDIVSLLSNVMSVCDDSSFIGYPYPLIKADDAARVTTQEVSYFQQQFFSQFDELTYAELKQRERSLSAHEILDSLKF